MSDFRRADGLQTALRETVARGSQRFVGLLKLSNLSRQLREARSAPSGNAGIARHDKRRQPASISHSRPFRSRGCPSFAVVFGWWGSERAHGDFCPRGSPCASPVRCGAGPSLCTANLGAEVTRGFWAFARPRLYNPFVYQQPGRYALPVLLRVRSLRTRLDGLTDRVEVHREVSPAPLTWVAVQGGCWFVSETRYPPRLGAEAPDAPLCHPASLTRC